MKKLEFLELQEVSMQEIISYSKLNSTSVTLLNDLNYGLFNQFVAWVDLLKIPIFLIKDTYKIAVIGNQRLALNIAKRLQVKCQTMYNAPVLKPKKILGKWHIPNRKSPYVVKAYNESGKPIKPFIDTDIETTDCKILSKYKFTPFKYAMRIRGSGNNKIESYEELRRIRRNFLNECKI